MGNEEDRSFEQWWDSRLTEVRTVLEGLASVQALVAQGARMLWETLEHGRRIFLFGNGGSAAQAAHIAAELVGRFRTDHRPLPAFALTVNPASLTAIANDFGYEQVFARQLEALARPGDLAIALSTSGRSRNVLVAVETARQLGLKSLAITGAHGDPLCERVDLCLRIPSDDPARIQEATLVIAHLWCEYLEIRFPKEALHD